MRLLYNGDVAGVGMRPVRLPLSKSIALRVMTLNAVCTLQGHREAKIPLLPDAEDVEGMARAMRALKMGAEEVNIGEGGAPIRFFTALAASTPGARISVNCAESLKRRPMEILIKALREAGANIHCADREGFPPLDIEGERLSPAMISLNPGVSSQYISALMMAAPLWGCGLRLRFEGGEPVSRPYIAMTAEIMRRFGVSVKMDKMEAIVPACAASAPAEFQIEPDWSAASYFYELALLMPGSVIPLEALTSAGDSLQGDSACEQIFRSVGVLTEIATNGSAQLRCEAEKLTEFLNQGNPLEQDMNDTPDLVPALAVGFCLAGVKFKFTSVGHLRHKETDRLTALIAELRKLGFILSTDGETLTWLGDRCESEISPKILTYSDHRMAMAFAPAAVKFPEIEIEHPVVVGKSFPQFWQQLEGLGFSIQ